MLRAVDRESGSKLPTSQIPGINCITKGSSWERERAPYLSGHQGINPKHAPSYGWEILSKSLYTSGLQSGFWEGDSERWTW